MSTWTEDELHRVGDARELRIASHRSDGTLRPAVTIWHVRVGDAIYVRSAHGANNGWFRRARSAGTGRISSGGVERDVTFAPADPAVRDDVDRAYHAKYDRYGAAPVGAVTGPDVLETTLRVMPRD
jgi:hypothetical protein